MLRHALPLLLSVLLLPVAASADTLVRNGGFEAGSGWTLSGSTTLDSSTRHSGARSVRCEGDGAAISQALFSVASGETLTVTGWMRISDVTPNGGPGYAYMAVYQYAANGKLVTSRDYVQQQGSADWRMASYTFRVEPGVEHVLLTAGLYHCSGTAWFDDITLAPGDQPVPYKDVATSTRNPSPYRAAVLSERGMGATGAMTPVTTVQKAMEAEGVPCDELGAATLADPAVFNKGKYDLLVVPTGARFPVAARRALLGFLMQGGDLLCTGGYAFDDLRVQQNGVWVSYARHQAKALTEAGDVSRHAIANGSFEDGMAGWTVDVPRLGAVDTAVAHSGRASGRITTAIASEGARFAAVLPVEAGRTYLIGAHARTRDIDGSGFAFLAVYEYDTDGKLVAFRDFAQIRKAQDWTRHEYRVRISPTATRVLFHAGLYQTSGSLWVDDVTCAPVEDEERINAHYGTPADGLEVGSLQLTMFNPDQKIQGVSLASAPGGPLSGAWRQAGPVQGFEATAQLRENARWLPLVEARDAYGRMAGCAGALVRHYSGPFADSAWAIFGVTNRDIFAGSDGFALLRRTVRLLRTEARADRLTTGYAFYRPGEVAQLTLGLANPAPAARTMRVRLTLHDPERPTSTVFRAERTVALRGDEHTDLRWSWRVPATCPDFVQVSATVTYGGIPVDRIETGFCVRNERVLAGGPRVTFERNAFTLRAPGRPAHRVTLFGTDTYGNMFGSPSCNPLTWYRDLRMMRDYGLHTYENLGFWNDRNVYSEAEWRKLDALIQLSQRFGLPYMAGLHVGRNVAVSDDELARQAAICGVFAQRYARAPGLIYYLNGDFQLHLVDQPDLRRLWNAFLATRYGTDAALRAAWGAAAPGQPIGEIPVLDGGAASWFDVRARDIYDFKTSLMKRWIGALSAAIRAHDRVHAITSEYYQRPFDGIDLRLTVEGMDVANIGFFGPPVTDLAQLHETVKWDDMTLAGRGMNIGEFGVKTHDAWADDLGSLGYHAQRTDAGRLQLFSWMAHTAWALGVTKIQNWCWSDDPDRMFPWGMAWINPLRPRDALQLYRNLRLVSDRWPQERAPESVVLVLPDSWRVGSPDCMGMGGLANAIECLLATGTSFDVASEAQIPLLADRHPRLVVAPLAYGMTDAAISGLRSLAEAGATVYVSGDPSVDPRNVRDEGRLPALCGVRAAGVRTHASGLPWVDVTPETAVANGSFFRRAIGKGAVVYSPEPWELLPGRDLFGGEPEVASSPEVNRYFRLLALSGVTPAARVAADHGAWRATFSRSGNRTMIGLFPRDAKPGSASVTVTADGASVRFAVADGMPCMLMRDGAGRPFAATCVRDLLLNSRTVASGVTPWALVSLDGRPLEGSRCVAVSSTGGGDVRWRTSAAGLAAWVVEWRNGRTTVVARAACSRRGKEVVVTTKPGDVVLVCPPSERTVRLRTLDRFGL